MQRNTRVASLTVGLRSAPRCGVVLALWLGAIASSGCATVRPEQRAVLADPIMQFESEPGQEAARRHVLENREGALSGGSIKGGGCGCN